MGFLQPLLLTLGVAASVPILLHLLQRHQGPRMIFPALRYLRRAEREHAKRIRFRQILLMILRVAAIVLLAAAAARPFLRAGGAAHAPTAVAIVLDNSMSTGAVIGDTRVLDELKARALETLDAADAQDRFWLIRAGSPWEPAWPGDAALTADRIRETTPGWAAADLAAAVERARAIVEAGADGRALEIHLLTDLQATGLSGVATGPASAFPLVIWAPAAAPPVNRSVTSVEIGGGAPPPAGLRTTAAVAVAGEGDTTVTVRLAVAGRVVGAAAPATGSAAVLTLPGMPAGPLWGYAETDPDHLRADDRRWFAMRIPEPPAVAVTADLGIAANGLDVLAESGRIRQTLPADADVVFSVGYTGAEAIAPAAAVIILPPESEAELPGVNRRLADAGIPWRMERGVGVGESRFATDDSDPLLDPLRSVRVLDAFGLVATEALRPGTDSVLLRLDDGTAWAVRGERHGGGRYMLLASSFSETATSFPESAALIPFLDRLVSVWAFGADASGGIEPGTEIALPAGITAVERPDGSLEPVPSGAVYRIGPEAGIYRLFSGESLVDVLAVNPPAAESDLRRADRSRVDAVFGGFNVTLASGDDWTDRIFDSRLGREAWRAAALFAVFLLVLESFVAAAGARVRVGVAAPAAAGSTPAVP